MELDMVLYSNIVNTIGILLEIAGVVILISGAKKLELELGSHTADHYVDAKTKQTPRVLTLPNDKRTKISVGIAIIGFILQIVGIWMTN